MDSAPTFRIETFGCKVNQYDSEAMREDLLSRGWSEASPEGKASWVVVDTCAVTHTAAREALRRIRQLGREPGTRVAVTGCLVPILQTRLETTPGAALLVPPASKALLGKALSDWHAPSPISSGASPPRPACLPTDPAATFLRGISMFAGRSRAIVKAQEGCDQACAYCIIPKARGRSRSRPCEDTASEAQRLVQAGFQELILTGIHLGAYGRDLPERMRWTVLVERLLRIPGPWRLRLSSIEAHEIHEEDIASIEDFCSRPGPRLCPHLHLPLQSGSPDVLRRMRRPGTLEAFERTVARLRSIQPDFAITTDVLVGFPGETDRDFENTLDAVRRLAFSRIHAFPFSPRPGTEAETLPDRVSADRIRARMQALASVARDAATAFHRRFLGRTVEVLVEEKPDSATGRPLGYSEHYLRVRLDSAADAGRRIDARVTAVDALGADATPAGRVPAAVFAV